MPVCPECGSTEMKFDRGTYFYVCKRCGLAVKRGELDRLRDQIRKETRDMESEEAKKEIKKKERKDYLKWLLSQK